MAEARAFVGVERLHVADAAVVLDVFDDELRERVVPENLLERLGARRRAAEPPPPPELLVRRERVEVLVVGREDRAQPDMAARQGRPVRVGHTGLIGRGGRRRRDYAGGEASPWRPAPPAKRVAPARDSPDDEHLPAVLVLDAEGGGEIQPPLCVARQRGLRAGRAGGARRARRRARPQRRERSPGSTSRLASPMRRASSPLTPRPVRIRSRACEWPMRRGQSHRAAVDQRHAPAPAEHAEHGVARRDAQVAPQRELEPARDREAFDRGDDRLREQHARRPHRSVAVGHAPVAAAVADRLEVGARAERAAGAGEHRDVVRVVGVEVAERIGEERRGRAVDRVAHLGAVDRDDRDATLVFDVDGHDGSPPRVEVGAFVDRRDRSDAGARRDHARQRRVVRVEPRAVWSRPSTIASATLITPPWQTATTRSPGMRGDDLVERLRRYGRGTPSVDSPPKLSHRPSAMSSSRGSFVARSSSIGM